MNNLEKFELGKCYRHSAGREMYICGVADTILWGTAFIAEENCSQQLTPVAMNDSDATCGWVEITKKEYFDKNYSV